MDYSVGQLYVTSSVIMGTQAIALLAYMVLKQKLSKDRFYRFLAILTVNVTCSLLPLGLFSVMFGLPAAFLSAVLITALIDKEGKQ
jgi:hypothetical protein